MLHRLALSSSSRVKACTSAAAGRQVTHTFTRALASAAASPAVLNPSESANDRQRHLGLLTVAAAAGLAGLAWNDNQSKTHCCGIAGVVGTPNHDAR
jgi:hypothetical protein